MADFQNDIDFDSWRSWFLSCAARFEMYEGLNGGGGGSL